MTAKKRIDVFIGSTQKDLQAYRDAVRAAITTLGLFPSGMETWAVEDVTAVEKCKQMVDEAEIYVGIYAYRYGWQPDGYDGKSITELEYDWATARGIPRLCFIMDENHPWPKTLMELDKTALLDAFKARVGEHLVGYFTNPDNLARQVTAALTPYRDRIYEETKANCNLVPPVEHFAGREKELEALQAALTDGENSVAITAAIQGSGGIGKSTLARYFAHHNGGTFPMALWAKLGERADEQMEGRILREWALALAGQTFPPDIDPEALRSNVRGIVQQAARNGCGEPMLLVIDDVWQDTLGIARKLRETVPDACLLVTTRSNNIRVALGCKPQPLPKMQPDEGAALMINLIGEAARAHEALLRRLSEVLDGYPLALTLAARRAGLDLSEAWLNGLIAEYDAGMKRGDDFGDLELDAGEDKEDSVSVTLRSTLDAVGKRPQFSKGKNDERNAKRQAQFRALGALPPDLPFRRKHIYALWGEADGEGIADLLAEGLLQADEREDWYSQHRLLRAYARALLREAGEFEDVTARHRDYLIGLARSVFVERQDYPETWGEVDDDLPQLHALGNELAAALAGTGDETEQDTRLHAMSETGETDADAALLEVCEGFGAAICSYVWGRYIGAEGRGWLWAALVSARAQGQQGRVGLFTGQLGSWHNQRGDKRAAIAYHEQSLEISRAMGDKGGEATTLNNLGSVYYAMGETAKALAYFTQALPLYQQVGDKGGEAAMLNNLGLVYADLGEKQKALAYFTQALPLRQQVGDKGGEAVTLNNIGRVYADLGEQQKALDYYAQALPLRQQVGDKRGEAMTLHNLGLVYHALGEQQKALDYYTQALPLLREVGDKGGEATTLHNLGMVYDALGEQQTALHYYTQALPLYQQVGDIYGEVVTLNNLGLVYADLGEQQKALDYFTQALPLRQQVGDKGGEAVTLNNIGGVYDDLGAKQTALDYYEQALPLYQQVGYIYGEAITRGNIAVILWGQDEREAALAHMQTARELKARMGISTQDEDKMLMVWLVMMKTGIYDEAELMEFIRKWQESQNAAGDKGEGGK